MSSKNLYHKLANILQEVVDQKMEPTAAIREIEAWKDLPANEREIKNAWHTLVHYQIDEDIRKRDMDYDEGMKRELRKQIEKLKLIELGNTGTDGAFP